MKISNIIISLFCVLSLTGCYISIPATPTTTNEVTVSENELLPVEGSDMNDVEAENEQPNDAENEQLIISDSNTNDVIAENEQQTVSESGTNDIEAEVTDTSDAEFKEIADVITDEGVIDLSISNIANVIALIDEIFEDYTKYEGKIIQVQGINKRYFNPDTDDVYHICEIHGGSCCGNRYIEYVLADNTYPVMNSYTTVRGTFSHYEDNDQTYYTLLDAVLVKDE